MILMPEYGANNLRVLIVIIVIFLHLVAGSMLLEKI